MSGNGMVRPCSGPDSKRITHPLAYCV